MIIRNCDSKDLKGGGSTFLKVPSQPGETEGNHDKPQTAHPVTCPTLEHDTFRIKT
jgi:hypothetical protein